MHMGEWLTRGTAWLALPLFVAGEMARAGRGEPRAAALWLNTSGCVAFLAHVACAFHFYHSWSHSAAYADTARRTAELSGWTWGGGLYLNYLFALVWTGGVLWSWASPISYLHRPRWLIWSVRTFFWFMILNGAVVFARGPVRWFGLILCLTLAGCWWPRRSRIADTCRG